MKSSNNLETKMGKDASAPIVIDEKEKIEHSIAWPKKVFKNPAFHKKRGRKRLHDVVKKTPTRKVKSGNTRKKHQIRTGRRFSVTGIWYIAAGYLDDIISLLGDFEKIEGWRFKDFAQCWQKKGFSLVYRGRQTFKELLEFAEEIVLITKRFLGPSNSVKRRIGALYTLYGLYNKFPIGKHHFFGLNFEMEEYKNVLDLIQPFRSSVDNPDPAFIFRKLELAGAFYYCSTSTELCYDFHNEERDNVELEYMKGQLARSSEVNFAVSNLHIDSELMNHYISVKKELGSNTEQVLSMLPETFEESVSNVLSKLRKDTLNELDMMNVQQKEIEYTQETASEEEADNSKELSVQELVTVVNKGEQGQKSQKALEIVQIIKDKSIRDFMKPPTKDDMLRPIQLLLDDRLYSDSIQKFSNSSENQLGIEFFTLSALDIDTKPNESQELQRALNPLVPPLKKKRGHCRPQALLKAQSKSTRGRKRKNMNSQNNVFYANLNDSYSLLDSEGDFKTPIEKSTNQIKNDMEDTLLLISVSSKSIVKTVKLKVKLTMKQFKEIQNNTVKFDNLKKKLVPLIKSTQKGKDRNRNWIVEDVIVFSDTNELDGTNEELNKHNIANSDTKIVPIKHRFECLKHSDDDDDEDSSVYSLSDEEDRDKEKKLDGVDKDYIPLSEESDGNDEPIEEIWEDDCDLDYEYQGYSRKRSYKLKQPDLGICISRGNDSENLLKLKNVRKMSMMPVKVGDKIRYIPYSASGDNKLDDNLGNNKLDNSSCDNELDKPEFEEDDIDESLDHEMEDDSCHTWNDYTSAVKPPYKRRYAYNSSPYYVTPKSVKNRTDARAPNNVKSSKKEPKKEPRTKEPPTVFNPVEIYNNIKDDPEVKKESTSNVVQELADDWDDGELDACDSDQELGCIENDVCISPSSYGNLTPSVESNYVTSFPITSSVASYCEDNSSAFVESNSETEIIVPDCNSLFGRVSDTSNCMDNMNLLNLETVPDINGKLYYKVLAEDGNNLYIPVSTFTDKVPSTNEIFSFDIDNTKPIVKNEFDGMLELADITDQSMNECLEPSNSISNPSYQLNHDQISMGNFILPVSDDPLIISPVKELQPIPKLFNSPKKSKPSCSFFFSPKMSSLKKLPSSKGVASGKAPVKSKPKVKFLFKGLLSSKKYSSKL